MQYLKPILCIILGSLILVSASLGILTYQSYWESVQKYFYGCFLYNAERGIPQNQTVDCSKILEEYLRAKTDLPLFRGAYLISSVLGIVLIVIGIKKIRKIK